MVRGERLAVFLLAVGIFAMGVLSLVYRDFAYTWQPVPAFPGRGTVAVVCGLFMMAVSVGLVFPQTLRIAARALFPFLIAWQCLKVPALIAAPKIVGVWLGFGETAVLLAGGWVVFARFSGVRSRGFFTHIAGERGVRAATILMGAALLPIGLSHLVYARITASLVPAWLPGRLSWAYITGIGQMACGLGVLSNVMARTAALIETAMLAIFAFLVWGPDTWFAPVPKLAGSPVGFRFPFTAFLITWVIGAAALIVAVNIGVKRGARDEAAQVAD